MIVMKFGGTSLQDATCVARAASIVAGHRSARPVVVVSAVGGVTRQLLRLGEAGARGDDDAVDHEAAAIEAMHRGILHGLGATAGPSVARLEVLADELRTRVASIRERSAFTAAEQDALISFGERLSSVLFAAAAESVGLPAERIDARSVIATDATFRHARPDRAEIDRRVPAAALPLVEEGVVPVIEGFIGATPAGQVTTMGFEASDLTASLVGAALRVSEVQIWTDVPGMLTTGHPSVAQPLVVPRLSFEEAAELALFGAKVLHPDSVAPARERRIPVRILHSRNPGGEGTWIADGDRADAPRIKAIAVTEDPADESFDTVRDTVGFPAGDWDWSGRSLICPVGAGIGTDDRLVERIVALVNDITASLPLPLRPNAIPLIVPRGNLSAAVRRLHEALVAEVR